MILTALVLHEIHLYKIIKLHMRIYAGLFRYFKNIVYINAPSPVLLKIEPS